MLRHLFVLLAVCATLIGNVAAGAHDHVDFASVHMADHGSAADLDADCCEAGAERAQSCHVWMAVVPAASDTACADRMRRSAHFEPPVTLSGIALPSLLTPPRAV